MSDNLLCLILEINEVFGDMKWVCTANRIFASAGADQYISQNLILAWVRLQIEPVEVATDDGGIVFASVQSVVPGAHGLYYRQDGQRRPLE
ncbi:unnamed protein product [Cylicostephanus goldi]|uniref:TAR DNA-binding protein 43 N-terminal domain-containing protein n=1 Tax=Cylicostephanus goldi TaxID=71465 RepID=A0A3P6PW89_CYLGO|nr:unnamed protein product [Cylicostephanus goldi]